MDQVPWWLDFDPVSASQHLLLAVVVMALVFSGPLVPGLSFVSADEPTRLGDGNATVSDIDLDSDTVQISPGRFGTNVEYLRVPAASLRIDSVVGQPRVVYRLQVPGLDVDTASTKLLGGSGRVTLDIDDQAFLPKKVTNDSYEGELTVRVQSISSDRTVFHETLRIEVKR